MKIISEEKDNSNIEHSLIKDILIPCFMYKIPIEKSKENKLNFIEETILKLIQIDNSLKNDVNRLSKMLGFYNEEKTDDKTKIISLILTKLKDLRIEDNEEKDETEVEIYQFYQEAYTDELLPIITKKINDYSYPQKNSSYKESSNRQISFKQNVNSRKTIHAILANGYDPYNISKPTKQDFIKTIFTHNQNNYHGSFTVDYKNFNIEILKPELIYLHTKLYILKNATGSFIITNGFTNDFSTPLRTIFESRHQKLLKILKQETKTDSDNNNNPNQVIVPFEDRINRYSDVKELIVNIEKESTKIKQDETSLEETQKSKDRFAQSLYDLIEKTFSVLSKGYPDTESLKDRKLLNTLAKDIGFKIDKECDLPIFKVHNKDNLQKYFAKTLIYKKDELYEISLKYPNLLFILKILFPFRNALKHSEKEEILKKIDINKLFEYKKIMYSVISIALHVKSKSIQENYLENDDDTDLNNAYLDLENEFNVDVMNQLPQEVKDNLTDLNYFINMDFDQNKRNIVEKVANNLYSSFELVIRKKTPGLPEKASLGYIVNHLYKLNATTDEEKLIRQIVKLRGHGSPNMEDVEKITKNELQELKNSSFDYIKKLIEDM
jgi:hypothetical protein